MRSWKIVIALGAFVCLGQAQANEHAAAPESKLDPKQVAEDIYKKCLSQAHQIKDEQVCKARKPSIDECVDTQTKAKDVKTAKAKCELLFTSDKK